MRNQSKKGINSRFYSHPKNLNFIASEDVPATKNMKIDLKTTFVSRNNSPSENVEFKRLSNKSKKNANLNSNDDTTAPSVVMFHSLASTPQPRKYQNMYYPKDSPSQTAKNYSVNYHNGMQFRVKSGFHTRNNSPETAQGGN